MPVQPSEQQVKDLKKTQADLWEKATMQESVPVCFVGTVYKKHQMTCIA